MYQNFILIGITAICYSGPWYKQISIQELDSDLTDSGDFHKCAAFWERSTCAKFRLRNLKP